ncbi:MAG TPA: helix-turn-helix transcriptional regulator [Acidimicrobiales bacterium]|nr:helix-turn-helix transcriptional regulator [Acidimicrobiales bacterium]
MPDADLYTLAHIVRARRTQLELTEEDVCANAGLSLATWSNLENAKAKPRPVTAAKICRALGWSSDSIAKILSGEQPEYLGTPIREKAALASPTPSQSLHLDLLENVASALQSAADEIRSAVQELRKSQYA